MLNTGVLSQIDGAVSTGKEANVYHALGPNNEPYAIKIFKTSILVFKDRERYVAGEFRHRRGFCKSNPRKMVQTWAEKEIRNLKRLAEAQIPSPAPIMLKGHVLVMQFIGEKDGWRPAPRLKDAQMSPEKWVETYGKCIRYMRKMYHQCRLVHADLSEYNMLFHNEELYFIDVSQSVEHDHPHSLDFLRMDCGNISDFFKKQIGPEKTLTVYELFNFITDPSIRVDAIDGYLEKALVNSNKDRNSPEASIKEAAFMGSFIPRTLFDVTDAERDIFEKSKAPESYYDTVTGIKHPDSLDAGNAEIDPKKKEAKGKKETTSKQKLLERIEMEKEKKRLAKLKKEKQKEKELEEKLKKEKELEEKRSKAIPCDNPSDDEAKEVKKIDEKEINAAVESQTDSQLPQQKESNDDEEQDALDGIEEEQEKNPLEQPEPEILIMKQEEAEKMAEEGENSSEDQDEDAILKQMRKENKKKVKEENREKRKNKVPKKEKQKLIKKTKK
eukprot:TRINITY_DN1193_c0_g1_i1.p1 TRINITY_DN1193_c0_g1~~TRINITY_DN1193_c0_g1_i1.p1  ORF type:complete len:499 (-),score=216.20 TRINITY_DN1193_c0_g1_i1:47-1543(-)